MKGLHFQIGACNLEFYDNKGEMKYDYYPVDFGNRYQDRILEVKIEENQELIGVYGFNDGNSLKSLGFIVKEKR